MDPTILTSAEMALVALATSRFAAWYGVIEIPHPVWRLRP